MQNNILANVSDEGEWTGPGSELDKESIKVLSRQERYDNMIERLRRETLQHVDTQPHQSLHNMENNIFTLYK